MERPATPRDENRPAVGTTTRPPSLTNLWEDLVPPQALMPVRFQKISGTFWFRATECRC